MHVTIDRKSEKEGLIFKKDAHSIWLTVVFSEEEKFAINQAGIKKHVYYEAPVPPNLKDPPEWWGHKYTKDLMDGRPHCICTVYNLVDLNEEEAKIREGLKNIKAAIEGTKEIKGSESFEL